MRKIGFVIAALMLGLAPMATRAGEPVKLVEGAEVRLKFLETLSSANAVAGQRFNLELQDDVRVAGLVVVPHGAKAVGTVVSAKKRGRMGKAGELNVLLDYLLVGEQRVRLRASSGQEGEGRVGSTVALTVLFGPIGLLKRGKDVEINAGTPITAYVDQTTVLEGVAVAAAAPAAEAMPVVAPAAAVEATPVVPTSN
jgi:hypothetical protein